MDRKFDVELYSRRVIDNRKIKMVNTIGYLLRRPYFHNLDIAVGYFYLSGLLLIKNEFTEFMNQDKGHLRILMGNETSSDTVNLLSSGSYSDYAQYIQKKSQNDIESISDRDFLNQVSEWLNQGRIEVKVYIGEANYFHAKSYLFGETLKSNTGTAIVGSSNFSKNGLEGNTELNVLGQDIYVALHKWFESLWTSKDEVKEFSPELVKITSSRRNKLQVIQEYLPVQETYFDFANLFAKPYAKLDETKDWVKQLYPHQRSGILEVKDRLDSFGTAVLADGVGLGKTRTAAGIIRLYIEAKSDFRILILADTKLKVQWQDEMTAVGIHKDSYSFMSREKIIRFSGRKLEQMNYSLIVVDEAHLGLKNNTTRIYQTLQWLKKMHPKTKGLMLTATPWNNRREDVLNIGALFLNLDGVPNDRTYKQYLLLGTGAITNKVVSRLASDKTAFNEFWSDIYLQRTRKTYGGQVAYFPKREFPEIQIPYEPQKNAIFEDNFDRISDLTFPYMDPIRYLNDNKEQLGANQLRLMLLKRADSSWKAYELTLLSTIDKLEKFKSKLENVNIGTGQRLLERYQAMLGGIYQLTEYQEKNIGLFSVEDSDSDEFSDRSKIRKQQYLDKISDEINGVKTRQAKSALKKMLSDSKRDLDVLHSLVDSLKAAYSKIDEKLDTVTQCVENEIRKGHKVVLISQFSDTVHYYYESLFKHFNAATITLRMGLVTGGGDTQAKINQNVSTKKEVLDLFSPRSKGQPNIVGSNREINLVVATDTISTGQNLQDAVTLMNIDLPYNPMILEQRIGRIDRPRSESRGNEIHVYTFPVYQSIDSQLKMAKRLGTKMEGILADTQFDNAVLPQYEDYLTAVSNKQSGAVERMLNETDKALTYNSGMRAEKHSEQYRQANQRMYEKKMRGIKRVANPLVPEFSFSQGDSESIIVAQIQYRDTTSALLKSENVIVSTSQNKKVGMVEAEKELAAEVKYDVHSQQVLNKSKALVIRKNSYDSMDNVFIKLIKDFNGQQSNLEGNMKDILDKVSQKAAINLRDNAMKNRQKVANTMKSFHIDPSQLGNIVKYVESIQRNDDLYPMIKEIAANPEVFWLHFNRYVEYFSSTAMERAEFIGSQRRSIETRKADVEKSKFKILLGNLTVNENE